MKLTKGNYDGASLAATFDLEISQMSKDQMQSLLECILHQAWPGEPCAGEVYEALKTAEENASLNNPYPRR
jgi:hypothetical protein